MQRRTTSSAGPSAGPSASNYRRPTLRLFGISTRAVEDPTRATWYNEPVGLPRLAADVTFARARHGRVYSAVSDWDEDRDPVIGETVLVADGDGRPFEAKIEWIDTDGTIALVLPVFAT